MRAASWLRDGRRLAEEGRSILEASEAECEAADVFVLIATVDCGGGLRHNNCDVPSDYLMSTFPFMVDYARP